MERIRGLTLSEFRSGEDFVNMRRRKPRSPAKRHTPEERNIIIARFVEARNKGMQPVDAVAGLGTSLASIYRWQRTRSLSKGMPEPTLAQELSINAAIARLSDEQNEDRHTFLEALFKLLAWLRWPTQPGDHPAAITVCVIAYLSYGRSAETLAQLPPDDLAFVVRHLRIDVLKRMCSFNVLLMPQFDLWETERRHYTQYDFIADITWFLLAYQPTSSKSRDAVSLSKAYFASQNKVFRRTYQLSQRTFRDLWLKNGAAAPFHYVERHYPSLEFTLDPSSDYFASQVEEIFARRGDLRRYLGHCRAATELLQNRLDPRSLQALQFPQFPDSLPAEAIPPARLPSNASAILNDFKSGHKPW